MTKYLIILPMIVLTACATARTKSSDPVMRIAIDPESISKGSYARLQSALFDSGKFIVVDRSDGFKAIVKEQEREHSSTRFSTNEKYSLWARLFGVGSIAVGTEQCRAAKTLLGKQYQVCVENLRLVNATTGEVLASSEVSEDTDFDIAPQWDNAVEKMVETFPKFMVTRHDPNQTVDYSSSLIEYREKTVPANSKKEVKLNSEDQL